MREVGAKTDDGRVSRAMTQCRLLLLGGGNPYVKIDSGQNGTKFTDCLKFFQHVCHCFHSEVQRK